MSNAKDWEIGLSTGWNGDASTEKFEFYAENGLKHMEMSMGHEAFLNIHWDVVVQNIKDYPTVNVWSVHLPFMPYKQINFGDTEGPAREYTIQMAKKAIDRMGELGIPHLVIHSGVDMFNPDREACLQTACNSLAEIAEYGMPKGVTVCVENMPRTGLGRDITEMKQLVASHPALRVCFDTNHLLRNRHVDFVRELGDKIVTLHILDYDFLDERHVFPYEGDIKWIELVEELEKVDYNGVWMYECGLGERKGLLRERPVTVDDLKENHQCCINKKEWQSFAKWDEEFCKANAYIKEPAVYHGGNYKRNRG